MRLLVKLATVNERSDENGSLAWSDTGDRYILRLFRDYVFHQKDDEGRNVIDFGHVLDALAKLDVGDPESIPLCSPDGKTLLVCSYEDVKRCLENVYGELVSQSQPLFPEAVLFPKYGMSMSKGMSSVNPMSYNTISQPITRPPWL